jgi:hypothetical protein
MFEQKLELSIHILQLSKKCTSNNNFEVHFF